MPRWAVRDYSAMPMPPEVDRAWAAGLYDGEGSTTKYGRRAAYSGKKPGIRMYLSQKNTGSELLDRLHKIFGVGNVKHREDRPGVWIWHCQDRAGCNRALEVMWPYLSSPKKDQAIRSGYDSAGK